MRLLAILTLILAASPRLGVAAVEPQSQQPPCETLACCEPVVVETCCGQTIEVVPATHASCPITGGSCACMAQPTEDSQPAVPAPMPRVGSDLMLAANAARSREVVTTERVLAIRRAETTLAALRANRTHNEAQALLGIWQT